MKYLLLLLVIGAVFFSSLYFFQQAKINPVFNGLPTVPCIDATQPITQSYIFQLRISIEGQAYPLAATIGHDAGNCLHDIFVKDTSGTVYVETNGNERFTLGNFFDVWHVTYNKNQLFGYLTGNDHAIRVFVNGREVETYEKTPITPNAQIEIMYQ